MRHICIFLLLLLAAPVLAASSPTPPPLAPALWEIRTQNARVTLFGTLHALPRDVDWFRPHVVAALDSADTLLVEAIPPAGPETIAELINRMAVRPAPLPLIARIPAARRPALTEALEKLDAPPLDKYDTWFAALTLKGLQLEAAGFDPRIDAGTVLRERARLRNIPVEALETPEQQLIYFDALPESDQAQFLIGTLEHLSDSEARLQQALDNWLAGDSAALAEQLNADFARTPMLMRLLHDDRNERWAYRIAEHLRSGKGHWFVAVGAGQLAGRASLVEWLRRHGFEAQRALPPPTAAPARSNRQRQRR